MRTFVRLGALLLAIALLGALAWQARTLRSVRGADPAAPPSAVAPDPPARVLAEGRLETRPGARVTVSSEVAGVLTNIVVQEKSRLRAGDPIATIKSDDVYASLMEARARVLELDSEILLATAELRRGEALAQTAAVTRQELDRLTQSLATLEARRTTAGVTVQRLEITLAKTRIAAPIDGVVVARYVHPGEVVNAGTPIVTLADLDRTWIEAEVDEFDAARVRVGATALVRAEGYTETWRGRVEEIPDTVNRRVLHPQDPARPSDVRVLLVKVALTEPTPLKLGQRAEVEIACE